MNNSFIRTAPCQALPPSATSTAWHRRKALAWSRAADFQGQVGLPEGKHGSVLSLKKSVFSLCFSFTLGFTTKNKHGASAAEHWASLDIQVNPSLPNTVPIMSARTCEDVEHTTVDGSLQLLPTETFSANICGAGVRSSPVEGKGNQRRDSCEQQRTEP